MKRAVIVAKGKVQKAGYRDFVQDSARELGITGYVENREDGDVKIVCEGKEAEIKQFIENIKVKKGFLDVSEASVSYEEPTGEFKLFKIKYGDVPEELGDRLGAAILYLNATNQKLDAGFTMLGGKMDEGREENKHGFGMLAGKIDEGREENKQGFGMLAGKIDEGREENKQGFGMLAGKMDMMLEKQDETIGGVREVSERIDRGKEDIVTEIGSLREDLKSYMEEKFTRIEHEVEAIKAKIGMV